MGRLIIVLLIVFVFGSVQSATALDVVPGLKGFGTDTRAAYAGSNPPIICIVGDLLDNSNFNNLIYETRNGTGVLVGSFRECIGLPTQNGTTSFEPNLPIPAGSGKIILFETSGNIITTSLSAVNENNDFVTIAGQSAPPPGITLVNIHLQIRGRDTLLQHIRSRPGDNPAGYDVANRRALSILSSNSYGIIDSVVIDHCSFTWGLDVSLVVYEEDGFPAVTNVTVSNCIIGESLNESLHPEQNHGKALALQKNVTRTLLLTSLVPNVIDRTPYIRHGSKVVVNNFIYNAPNMTIQVIDGEVNGIDISVTGNYMDVGNITGVDTAHIIRLANNNLNDDDEWNASEVHLENNCRYDGTTLHCQTSASDWNPTELVRNDSGESVAGYQVLTAPLWPTGLVALDSSEVKSYVLNNAGAFPKYRDDVDLRQIAEAQNNTGPIDAYDVVYLTNSDCTDLDKGPGGIDMWCCTGLQTGNCRRVPENGWPDLDVFTTTLSIPSNPHAVQPSGYTNLEEWLHQLAADVENQPVSPPPSPLPEKSLQGVTLQ